MSQQSSSSRASRSRPHRLPGEHQRRRAARTARSQYVAVPPDPKLNDAEMRRILDSSEPSTDLAGNCFISYSRPGRNGKDAWFRIYLTATGAPGGVESPHQPFYQSLQQSQATITPSFVTETYDLYDGRSIIIPKVQSVWTDGQIIFSAIYVPMLQDDGSVQLNSQFQEYMPSFTIPGMPIYRGTFPQYYGPQHSPPCAPYPPVITIFVNAAATEEQLQRMAALGQQSGGNEGDEQGVGFEEQSGYEEGSYPVIANGSSFDATWPHLGSG